MKIIFLNGPPGSGKDTIANLLLEHSTQCQYPARNYKFSGILKSMVHGAYGLDYSAEYYERKYGHAWKSTPNRHLNGKTPRECYIAFSETYIKPLHGMTFFGERLADEMFNYPNTFAVISDSGFDYEAPPVLQKFGYDNCVLVRVHRTGMDFTGDSRSYIELPIKTVDFHNDRKCDINDPIERDVMYAQLKKLLRGYIE
jgi:hypothetical protein